MTGRAVSVGRRPCVGTELRGCVSEPATNSILTFAVSANTLFNLTLGYVTWKLRNNAAQVDKLEEKLERQRTAAEAKQHELTDKLVDARLRDFTHQLGQLMQKAQTTSDAQERFIEDAERKLERLTDKDHQGELQTLERISRVQIEIAKNAVTKEDMKEHERSMRQEMNQLREQVRAEFGRKG